MSAMTENRESVTIVTLIPRALKGKQMSVPRAPMGVLAGATMALVFW